MKKETIKNTTNHKFYKVKNLGLFKWDDSCEICKRYGVCKPKHGCKPFKGLIRNWKEYRKTQYK